MANIAKLKKVVKSEVTTANMRIIKISTCSTLSGRSELTYHVGCNTEGKIFLKISANSGCGLFNPDWLAYDAIKDALNEAVKPVTSYAMFRLFTGRSSNSPGFLFAILLAEKLISRNEDSPRYYVLNACDFFEAEMSALISTPINIEVKPTTAKSNQKVALPA